MLRNNLYIICIAFAAAIGGFLLGFDGSVISGAVPFYKTVFHLNDGSFLLGFSVSCIIWGAIIGNLIAGPLSDKFGRKTSLFIAALLFTVTGLVCAFANNISIFILGRVIGGLGVGIAILVAPVYIAEISPARKRGWLVSFNQLLIVIGLSAAYFSNYFILKTVEDPLENWRWMLGMESVPAVLYLIIVLFIPESPRWLIMQGKDEKALLILQKVSEETDAKYEYEEIKKSIFFEKKGNGRAQWKELFDKKMKHILIIGFGLGILQQFSGINAILYYAPMVFESAGGGRDTAFLQAIALGIVFVVMTIISMFLIDRLGRKPLLYMGASIMAISLTMAGSLFYQANYQINAQQVEEVAESVFKNGAIISSPDFSQTHFNAILTRKEIFVEKAAFFVNRNFGNEILFYKAIDSAYAATGLHTDVYKPALLKHGIHINAGMVLLSILGFIAGFSISLGPVMWAMFSEIFPNRLRGIAISIVGAANALASFVVATFFPLQLVTLGSSGTYFLYAGLMYFCLWFVWKYVVETKGKSLEQLEKELIKT